MEEKEASLLDFIYLIALNKKTIGIVCGAAFVISTAICFLLPNRYVAATRFMVPGGGESSIMSRLAGSDPLAAMGSDLLRESTRADVYASILKSRSVKDRIIDKFEMMNVYHKKFREETYKALENNYTVNVGKKDGVITFSFQDKDPQRSADIANAFVEEMSRIYISMNIAGSGKNRIFLEEQLSQAQKKLAESERELSLFKLKNKTVSLEGQTVATIAGAAQLKSELATQEIKLGTLLSYQTENSPEVKETRSGINSLKRQIGKLENNSYQGAVPSMGSIPDLSERYIKLLRNYKEQEYLVDILKRNYEIEHLKEIKNLLNIQVIDRAVKPDKKAWPPRKNIIIASTFSAFFAAIGYFFVLENSSEKTRRKMEVIIGALKIKGV